MVLPASLLFLIRCVGIRTAVLRRKITVFETIQSVTCFFSVMTLLFLVPQFPPRRGHCVPVVGSACYAAAWGMPALLRAAQRHVSAL